MHWIVLSPFHENATPPSQLGAGDGWILEHISPDTHTFTIVPAPYVHDRSRSHTSARQWLDYARHAWAGWRAARAIKEKPIGFITLFPQLALMVGLIKRLSLARFPVLAWCFNLGRTYAGAKGVLARFALRSVNLFIVVSRRERDTYARWLGLPTSRFVFVPLSVAAATPTSREEPDAPFVLAMGTANRDYRLLFAAMAPSRHRLIVVSGAHALSGLEVPDFVDVRAGLTSRECQDLSERARLNVVPLRDAATAAGVVSLLEAMILGKAVIATRTTGTLDYIEDGRTGIMTPPDDEVALRAAIERVWSDSALRESLGQSARSRAVSDFTFAAAARRMRTLLDGLESGARSGLSLS